MADVGGAASGLHSERLVVQLDRASWTELPRLLDRLAQRFRGLVVDDEAVDIKVEDIWSGKHALTC
jgi:hypothetical protein